jgi:hypothetical protein
MQYLGMWKYHDQKKLGFKLLGLKLGRFIKFHSDSREFRTFSQPTSISILSIPFSEYSSMKSSMKCCDQIWPRLKWQVHWGLGEVPCMQSPGPRWSTSSDAWPERSRNLCMARWLRLVALKLVWWGSNGWRNTNGLWNFVLANICAAFQDRWKRV